MTTMSQAVAAAVKRGRSSDSYLGTITAVNVAEAAITVDIGTGTPLTGVRWGAPFASGATPPAVNDFVVVLRIVGSWVVMAKLSKDLRGTTPPPIQGEARLNALASFRGTNVPPWQWAPWDAVEGLSQGRAPSGVIFAGVSVLPRLNADLIPAGSTITSAKLRTGRIQPGGSGSGGAALVRPALYGHAYTESPVGTPSWSTSVWRPGQVAPNQAAQWDLPSAWLTALLAGTMRGVGFYSTASADWSIWTPPVLTITYTTPA